MRQKNKVLPMFATRRNLGIFLFFFMSVLFADSHHIATRNIWEPQYHGKHLAYCRVGGIHCGLPVANRYCQLLGYDGAKNIMSAMNVGLSHFIDSPFQCVGWQCKGFKKITCVREEDAALKATYHYRQRRFVFPRYNHYRLHYCYDGEKGCGRQAAYSFCRRLGYMRAIGFSEGERVSATSAIGNQKLCFKSCRAFSKIDCYR